VSSKEGGQETLREQAREEGPGHTPNRLRLRPFFPFFLQRAVAALSERTTAEAAALRTALESAVSGAEVRARLHVCGRAYLYTRDYHRRGGCFGEQWFSVEFHNHALTESASSRRAALLGDPHYFLRFPPISHTLPRHLPWVGSS